MTYVKRACAAALGASVLALAALPAAAAGGPPPGGFERMFGQLDADGDGRITREEFEAGPQRRFEAMDTDGDGKVTAAELEIFMVARAKDRAAMMMERLDADGDGTVTLVEIEKTGDSDRRDGRRMRMFDRMDENDDGAVTKAEAEAGWKRMAERRGERHGHGEGRRGDCPGMSDD